MKYTPTKLTKLLQTKEGEIFIEAHLECSDCPFFDECNDVPYALNCLDTVKYYCKDISTKQEIIVFDPHNGENIKIKLNLNEEITKLLNTLKDNGLIEWNKM